MHGAMCNATLTSGRCLLCCRIVRIRHSILLKLCFGVGGAATSCPLEISGHLSVPLFFPWFNGFTNLHCSSSLQELKLHHIYWGRSVSPSHLLEGRSPSNNVFWLRKNTLLRKKPNLTCMEKSQILTKSAMKCWGVVIIGGGGGSIGRGGS